MMPLAHWCHLTLANQKHWEGWKAGSRNVYPEEHWPKNLLEIYERRQKQGLTRSEIASELGVTESALKIRVERLRA